jgi:ankyrin repeat protein
VDRGRDLYAGTAMAALLTVSDTKDCQPHPAQQKDEATDAVTGIVSSTPTPQRSFVRGAAEPEVSVLRPAPDAFVQASFYRAAEEGNVKLVKLGLESDGADINGRNERDGWSALHYAAHRGHYRLVKYLLQVEGIDKNLKDLNGCTPADVAKDHDIESLICS